MSDRIPAPASVTDLDETESRDVAEDTSASSRASPDDVDERSVSSANRNAKRSGDVAEQRSARSQAQPDDSSSDARSDEDDSEFRTATRLLRLLKLALGTLVSFLTALKLLGVL